VSHAKDVARRMLDHGAGDEDDSLSRYWDDDERNLDLQSTARCIRRSTRTGGCHPRLGRIDRGVDRLALDCYN
jgi:hypothetical protein